MSDLTSSGFPDPITNPKAWSVLYIGNTASPGIIDKDGIQGFARKIGWDVKKGKGAKGATMTLESAPPSTGSFRFVASTPADFVAWDSFLPLLKYTNVIADKQAVAIYHPCLVDVGVSAVVVEEITPWRHVGLGKYVRTISFIEWTPPPKKSIVATPVRAKETGSKPAGDPPDPVADAQQATIAALLKLAQRP
jgi:hypothetical protein